MRNFRAFDMRWVHVSLKQTDPVHSPLPAGHLRAPPERTAPVVFEQIAHAVHAWHDAEGKEHGFEWRGMSKLTTPLAGGW